MRFCGVIIQSPDTRAPFPSVNTALPLLCPFASGFSSTIHSSSTLEFVMSRSLSPILSFSALLVLQLFQPSLAQYIATFQYPTGGEIYNVLDTVVVQYTSNYSSTTLFTWIWDVTSGEGQEGAAYALDPLMISPHSLGSSIC